MLFGNDGKKRLLIHVKIYLSGKEMRFALPLVCAIAVSLIMPAISAAQTDVTGEDLSDVQRYPGFTRIYHYASGNDKVLLLYSGPTDASIVENFYKSSMTAQGWNTVVDVSLSIYDTLSSDVTEFTNQFTDMYLEYVMDPSFLEIVSSTMTASFTNFWMGGYQKGDDRALIYIYRIENTTYVWVYYLSNYTSSQTTTYEQTYDNQSTTTDEQTYDSIPTVPVYSTQPYASVLENVSLDLFLEFKSTGRLRLKADYSGPNPLYSSINYYSTSTSVPAYQISPSTDSSPAIAMTAMTFDDEIKIAVVTGSVPAGEWEYSVSTTSSYSWATGNTTLEAPYVSLGTYAPGTYYVGVRHKTSGYLYLSTLTTISETATFSASPALPTFELASTSSTKPVGWDLDVRVTSSGNQTIAISASGWAILPLSDSQEQMLALAVAGYKIAPQTGNDQLKQQLNYMFKYYGVEITSANLSQLEWDGSTSKLTFSANVTAKGSMFGESLIKELPLTITTNGNGNFPVNSTSTSAINDLALDIFARLVGNTVMAELQVNLTEASISVGIDFEFELRPDSWNWVTKTDDILSVDFGALRKFFPYGYSSPQVAGTAKLSFTMRVPQNAQLENLPSGYTQSGTDYNWTGQSALDAALTFITGGSGTKISYYVGPASVTLQNIGSSVGQTIPAENSYVESVHVESETAFTVNLQRDQPVKKIRIVLAQKAQDASVQTQQLSEKPSNVIELPSDKKVSYYLNIETSISDQIQSASVEFSVPKLWISVENIDTSSIRLLRYHDGTWTELETTKLSEDENDIHFSAQTPGFSTFAVTGVVIPNQSYSILPPYLIVFIALAAVAGAIAVVMWKYLSRGSKELPSLKTGEDLKF